jgi:hypothetical protein
MSSEKPLRPVSPHAKVSSGKLPIVETTLKFTHLLTGCLEKQQIEKPALYHSQMGCLK